MQTQNGQLLYNVAKANLGQKLTIDNASDDYGILGCAETLNNLALRAWGHQIGGGFSTFALWQFLKDSSKFQPVTSATSLPGDIVISPTGSIANATLKNGHCGVVGMYGILSNNSEDGTVQENYSIPSWLRYYTDYGGLPTLFFRPL